MDGQDAARRGRMAVAAMFAVNGFLMGSWAPQIPFMLPRHQITETTLGLLILLFGVGAMAAMPWTGGLIHRHGSRKVVRGFALIASLSLAAVVLSPNLWTVAPMLMLMGGFVGCMDVSMNANAVEVEKQLGRAIMSSSHGFWSLGGFRRRGDWRAADRPSGTGRPCAGGNRAGACRRPGGAAVSGQ